ncbi:MAG: hypothetical protein U0L92_07235 [Clostridia bacterium]|nr:hypothetical protein [Clostridia bacterium]
MLNELERQYGISGLEAPVREYLKKSLQGHCSLTEDGLGNLIARKQGRSDKKLLLVVHMDEPGIIITKITEDGYLQFHTIGRLRPEFLVSKGVHINGYPGVIAVKAVHLTTKEERETPLTAADLFVDIGADSRKEAEKLVTIGDCGAIDGSYVPFGDDMVKGRALGGRMGCVVAAELLKEECPINLEVVFAVQREIGNRGMLTAAHQNGADAAIVLDGIWEEGLCCGKGVVLPQRMGVLLPDKKLCDSISQIAQGEEILLQKCLSGQVGQEAVIAKSGGFKRWACLGIPVRYGESTAQVASLADMESLKHLLRALLQKLEKESIKS